MLHILDWPGPLPASLNLTWDFFCCTKPTADVCVEDKRVFPTWRKRTKFELAAFHHRALIFMLSISKVHQPVPEGLDNILSLTHGTHTPLLKPTYTIPPGLAKLSEATGYS